MKVQWQTLNLWFFIMQEKGSNLVPCPLNLTLSQPLNVRQAQYGLLFCVNSNYPDVQGLTSFRVAHQIFTKFSLENMISIYTKDVLWIKLPKFSIFQRIFLCESPNFYDKFQQVVKNIEGFCFFSTFISSMQPNLAKLFSQPWQL